MWSVPQPPDDPHDPATLQVVRDARLSAWSSTANGAGPSRDSTGAVYDAQGGLVRESLRLGGFAGDHVVAVDPPAYDEVPEVRLGGRWLYGGHWMNAYGHFITETLTTLWPDQQGYSGIVFHRFLHTPAILPWQLELLHRSGWNLPLYVAEYPISVGELVVPSRPFHPNRSTTEESVSAWDRAVRDPAPGPNLFMSRSRLPKNKQRTDGDDELDEQFAKLGFRIMHPQEVTLSEQLDAAGGANILAGLSGSALHTSAILPQRTKILELGDPRTPTRPIRTQVVIDAARRRRHEFVPFYAKDARTRDIEKTMSHVLSLL